MKSWLTSVWVEKVNEYPFGNAGREIWGRKKSVGCMQGKRERRKRDMLLISSRLQPTPYEGVGEKERERQSQGSKGKCIDLTSKHTLFSFLLRKCAHILMKMEVSYMEKERTNFKVRTSSWKMQNGTHQKSCFSSSAKRLFLSCALFVR